MRRNKLSRHLETLPVNFLQTKLKLLGHKSQNYVKLSQLTRKLYCKVVYRRVKSTKPHTIGQQLILPASIGMAEIMFAEELTMLTNTC